MGLFAAPLSNHVAVANALGTLIVRGNDDLGAQLRELGPLSTDQRRSTTGTRARETRC